ncbi:MAG: tetratricopeptide repeat protein [Nitrospinales bacterium]
MSKQKIRFRIKSGWKVLTYLFFIPWLFVACSALDTKDDKVFDAQQKYRESVKFRNLKMRDEMYAGLKEAIRLDPKEPLYHFELASAYFTDSKLPEAETEFLTTLNLEENFIEAYKRLGRLYMSQGKWDNAIHYLKDVSKKSGVTNPHQVHNWLAISYYAQGKVNLAEKAWREALGISENSEIRLNLALAYKANEKFDLATESLEKAIELDPDLVRAHYEIAQLYLKANNKELAKKHFTRVIDLEPLSKYGKPSQEYLRLIQSGK